ncbi:PREDICTED: uncharacterized protein LOC108557140 [Nicrophorus vespilloides]|uniref:Uncharacterized protein LOC108557140 n=1 Tax=Nicrophorus vespilloides TaxID=110193 RepID=A0ABM1M384_NICVS|nr:PREDICTED: uncharacterized protein LOC108557140 [Nicrophorus vespilloides]
MVPVPFSKNPSKTTFRHSELRLTMNSCSLKMITVIVSALVLALHYQETEAKRGCANFGHSCYGGMGKRDGGMMEIEDTGKLEENPALIFAGSRGDYRPEREVYVSPFMRQLLRNLRTAQQQLQQRDVFDEK